MLAKLKLQEAEHLNKNDRLLGHYTFCSCHIFHLAWPFSLVARDTSTSGIMASMCWQVLASVLSLLGLASGGTILLSPILQEAREVPDVTERESPLLYALEIGW